MMRAVMVCLCMLSASAASASTEEYGPNDAIGRLIAYADSIALGPPITEPRPALWWFLHDGDEPALALLESTIANPATPEGYKQWLLEQTPDYSAGPSARVPCGSVALLERLLAPGRLSPEVWALCFKTLSYESARAPGCLGEDLLSLVETQLEDPEFLGSFSALRILGAAAVDGQNAILRRRARELFWRGLDKLTATTGELAPPPGQLNGALCSGLRSLPMKHPPEVDRGFLERVTESLHRSLHAREDSRALTGLLIATLRERPDLRRHVDWAGLRAAFLSDTAPAALPEAQVVALSNLLPYAPQWIDEALVSSLLAALVPKVDSLRLPNQGSHFGGAPEALAACANYGQDPRLTRRIESRLLALASDYRQPPRAQVEALDALAAVLWQQPSLLDDRIKRALRGRLRHAELENLRSGPEGRALELLHLSFELRPDLITHRDLSALGRLLDKGGRLRVTSLEGVLVALAKGAPDDLYAELETMLVNYQARVAGDLAEFPYSRDLLARVRCERVGISPCN